VELFQDFRFEAAHRLPYVPAGHKCARLHGHSYRVRITVKGQPDPTTGMVVDFADIAAAFEPIIHEHLDHNCLNDIEGLENPTAEHLARWIWVRLQPGLPLLHTVELHETDSCGVVYRGD